MTVVTILLLISVIFSTISVIGNVMAYRNMSKIISNIEKELK